MVTSARAMGAKRGRRNSSPSSFSPSSGGSSGGRRFTAAGLGLACALSLLVTSASFTHQHAASSAVAGQSLLQAWRCKSQSSRSRSIISRAVQGGNGGGEVQGEEDGDSQEWLLAAKEMRERMEVELIKANSLFYDSLSGQDSMYLEEAWSKDPVVHLMRPAFQEHGHASIVRACKAIGKEAKSKKCKFVPSGGKVTIAGATGWMVFREHLKTSSGAAGRSPYYVTNVFRRVGDKWKLFLHHATATQDRSAQPGAVGGVMTLGDLLQAMGGGGGGITSIGGGKSAPRIIQLSSATDGGNGGGGGQTGNGGGLDGVLEGFVQSMQGGDDGGANGGEGVGLAGGGGDSMEARIAQAERAAAEMDSANMTKKTVNAIREAFVKGMISEKQKQMLLTHIIRKAPDGELTQVEMAFEILIADLLAEDEEYSNSLSEFAEQCRVFAHQLDVAESEEADSDVI